MDIAVVIKDSRMNFIAKRLSNKANVFEVRSNDDITYAHKNKLIFDVIVLPMSGVDDGGSIKINNNNVLVRELLKLKRNSIFIYTGVVNHGCVVEGGIIINLSNNQSVKVGLAQLTAHGILDILITKTPCNFKSYTYDILGYGACGKEIYKLLSDNKCNVRCITRKANSINDKHFIDYKNWKCNNPSNIVINTTSVNIINENTITNWTKSPIIIDIASGGIGVSDSLKKQYNPIIAGNLPSISGPLSACDIICDVIEEDLNL